MLRREPYSIVSWDVLRSLTCVCYSMGKVPLAIRSNLFRITSTDFAVVAEFDMLVFNGHTEILRAKKLIVLDSGY